MGIMQLINVILFWVFFGLLAAHFAKKRGRRPLLWFFIGIFLGVIGVLLVFLLPQKKREEPLPAFKPNPFFKSLRSDAWIKMWYYLDPSHKQQGPIEFLDLIKIWKKQELSAKSFVWGEGMNEWKRLAELPDLIKEMEQH